MSKALRSVSRFVTDQDGTESLEWALVAGLIVIGGLTAIYAIGPKITTKWNSVNTAIQ
jgi:pilus assembly protein Flp/PilA